MNTSTGNKARRGRLYVDLVGLTRNRRFFSIIRLPMPYANALPSMVCHRQNKLCFQLQEVLRSLLVPTFAPPAHILPSPPGTSASVTRPWNPISGLPHTPVPLLPRWVGAWPVLIWVTYSCGTVPTMKCEKRGVSASVPAARVCRATWHRPPLRVAGRVPSISR